ncbi:MAG: lipopolysaccharide biosynthesis protein [Pseudomonadota bacterium]|nr:lipopolysaccharide biosynthesis protein [Pseudomonadota bacterium]
MNSLRNDTAIYGLAQAGERLLSFFLLPLLTKAVSPADYAIWTQSVVVAGVLVPIVLLGFQTALVKCLPVWSATPRRRDSMLLAMLLAILGLLSLLALGMVLYAAPMAMLVFGAARHADFIPLLACLLVSEALFEFLVGILRGNGLIRRVALYGLLKGFWRIALLVILLDVAGTGFATAFAGFVLLQLLFVALMYGRDLPIGQLAQTGLATGRPHWRETLAFSLPLVPLALLTAINNFSDRFFLIHLHGLDEAAIYSAAYSLAAIAIVFYSVLGFTLFPALSRYWAEGRHEQAGRLLVQAISVYLFFLFPFIAGLSMVGPGLLPLLSTTSYVASAWLFLVLGTSIGLFGLYQIALYITLLGDGSLRNLKPMATSALIAIALNALLVAPLGGIGAALAGCAANAVLAAITLHRAKRLLAWRFPWRTGAHILARTFLMLAVLAALARWVGFASPLRLLAVVSFAALTYLVLDVFSRRESILALLKNR